MEFGPLVEKDELVLWADHCADVFNAPPEYFLAHWCVTFCLFPNIEKFPAMQRHFTVNAMILLFVPIVHFHILSFQCVLLYSTCQTVSLWYTTFQPLIIYFVQNRLLPQKNANQRSGLPLVKKQISFTYFPQTCSVATKKNWERRYHWLV